jgi:probable F420-dependent oxidoreductase
MTVTPELGRYGVWRGESGLTPELAVAAENAGFGTLWIGGSPPADLRSSQELLDATTTLVVATGIVNVWATDPHEAAASYHRIAAAHPDRFVLGIGIGHPEHTKEYRSPFETLAGYVDVLLADGVPREGIVLAALGPRVMRLSRDRTAGAHPYLTTPAHTREAREILGAGPVLAPEHKVVLDEDPVRARALGRAMVERYTHLSNYVSSWHRIGFTDADTEPPGSDALIDATVAHGTDAEVAAKGDEHLDAGASHVAVQLLTEDDADHAAVADGWRRLGIALTSG